MGQCCVSCMKSKRRDPYPDSNLALKPQEVALLADSWLPIRHQEDFATLFLTWYVMTPTNHQLPANLSQFANQPPEELASSEKFQAAAKTMFRDFDRIVTTLEHPQELKIVLDSITESYIKQELTDTDFQNLAFSLIGYLKGVGALSPASTLAWTQTVNRVSLYIWDSMQKHHAPGRLLPFKIT